MPVQWYKATVPSTVLAAQVANGEFDDIFYSDNLRKLARGGIEPNSSCRKISRVGKSGCILTASIPGPMSG
jgi:hypothetical protein